jgi:hypothetical protein
LKDKADVAFLGYGFENIYSNGHNFWANAVAGEQGNAIFLSHGLRGERA